MISASQETAARAKSRAAVFCLSSIQQGHRSFISALDNCSNRYQSGTSWRRDFANGYVLVDPISHAATISTTPAVPPTATLAPTLVPSRTSQPTLVPTNVPTLVATNPATVVPTKTATPAATTVVYDEKDAAFVYSAGWTDYPDAQAYNGAYKLTKVIGSSVSLNFTGQSFTIVYKAGPLLRKMDIYVDGKLVGTLDQYASSATYQRKWKYGGTLAAGPHTLKLVFVGPKNARGNVDAVTVP